MTTQSGHAYGSLSRSGTYDCVRQCEKWKSRQLGQIRKSGGRNDTRRTADVSERSKTVRANSYPFCERS